MPELQENRVIYRNGNLTIGVVMDKQFDVVRVSEFLPIIVKLSEGDTQQKFIMTVEELEYAVGLIKRVKK